MGIVLVAQWSSISNITDLTIYFNHPIKNRDAITVMDKYYQIDFFLAAKNGRGNNDTW